MSPEPWWTDALCAPHRQPASASTWWTERPRDGWGTGAQRMAIAICRQCPVRLACLEDALKWEAGSIERRWGIWGGTLPAERARIAKAAA